MLRRDGLQVLPMNHLGARARGYGLLMPALMDVHSSGRVSLVDPDPHVHPHVEFRMLSDPADVAALVRGVELTLALAAPSGVRGDRHGRRTSTTRARPSMRSTLRNGSPTGSPASVGDYVHASCSCRMGVVVDDDCRVNGYSGLFVCDASVFADIPPVNTHIPTVMLAETMATALVARRSRIRRERRRLPQAFPHVFAPLQLRHRTLRSRINFGAHTANMGEDGLVSDRHIAYYRERALGGAGMIVVEPMPVHRTAVLTRGNFRADDDSVIPGFRQLTDACRDAADGDIVMIHQLYHVGQHGDADNSFAPNWSPSGLPSYHDADGSHAMTEAEILELIDAFVRAAGRARASGFDGVELFAAYHAVIDQFWTPWSNRRTDRWGGSLENRVRFSATLLEAIREGGR